MFSIRSKSALPAKMATSVTTTTIGFLCAFLLHFTSAFAQQADRPVDGWTLRDSADSNLTSMDPIRIVDAFSLNVLANVYEGLVSMTPDGRIVPGLAERWETSPDGRTWTFHLRSNVRFHPAASSCPLAVSQEVTARDVVYSLRRSMSSSSLYRWALADLIEGAGAGNGDEKISGLIAPDAKTVIITLTRRFPLLNRLVMVAGWVYPADVAERCGENYLTKTEMGTGAYRLASFIPDDKIVLRRFSDYREDRSKTAPATVEISIFSQPQSALEAFKSGRIDAVDVSLATLQQARQLAKAGQHKIIEETANYLDYLVFNNALPPFNDVRVRRAINAAIDRDQLRRVLSGTVVPAFGFIPPASPAYRGQEAIRKSGFRLDIALGKSLIKEYLAANNLQKLELTLTVDAGELPETIGDFVQASLQRNLGIDVTLRKVTWPEMLQAVFSGQGVFYRFWWNIVTPSEDIYFQFFFPGNEPPKGFNVSSYEGQNFVPKYWHVMETLDSKQRRQGVAELEDQLIQDAAAVPLFHRTFYFLIRRNVALPINNFLQKSYLEATTRRN